MSATPRGDQVVLRLLGDVAGVAGVRLTRDGVAHEAVDVQGLVLAERVDDSGVGVGHEEHVRLLDLLEAPDRRAVEAEAVLERPCGQLVGRNGKVLHKPRQVAEAEVDDLDPLLLDQRQDLLGRAPVKAKVGSPFLCYQRRQKPVRHAAADHRGMAM